MQANLPDLFGNAKPAKRKTPSQKEFEKENMALLLEFKAIVFGSFDALHNQFFTLIKPGGGMDNKFPAITIISLIRTKVIEKFPQYCGKATKGRFKLVTPTQSNIYLKKLDARKRPLNRQSGANDLILRQLTKSNEDKGGNVFLGYVTNREYTQILGIYAVCLDGADKLWECDVLELARKREAKVIRMRKREEKLKLKPGAIILPQEQQKRE